MATANSRPDNELRATRSIILIGGVPFTLRLGSGIVRWPRLEWRCELRTFLFVIVILYLALAAGAGLLLRVPVR
jgi:hypothetical protein